MVAYQHLCDETAFQKAGDLVDYIRKVGCIQYDPLNVVGKNPDLVLQARFQTYRKGDIDKYLYADRVIFDVWDKNMSISTVDDWSGFQMFRRRYLDWCREHQAVVGEITEYLQAHDSACSSDFGFEEKVGWHYGPQRLAKAALEAMCYAGLAVVHHKKGTRRYYSLAEKHIPEPCLNRPAPYRTEEEYYRWGILRRINAIGLLWNRPSDAWLGIIGLKSGARNQAFRELQDEGRIVEIHAAGMKHPLYIAAENLEMLQAVAGQPTLPSSHVRILAPLDNLLWDRKLVAELFGFEYKWEVYTPVPERKYGYYVLPVLCGHRLVGRVELETDRKTKALLMKHFWPEDEADIQAYKDKILAGIHIFQEYNHCDRTEILCSI